MKQEIAKLEELIKEELQMVKTYPEKPAYYLQINKTGCRLLVRVDDIPIGYHFVENEGESMLYPIKDLTRMIWGKDNPSKSTKSLRSVSILKLRKILERKNHQYIPIL